MKMIKLAILAATMAGVGVTATAAQARPHRHQVCSVKIVHHHRVKHCYWR